MNNTYYIVCRDANEHVITYEKWWHNFLKEFDSDQLTIIEWREVRDNALATFHATFTESPDISKTLPCITFKTEADATLFFIKYS